MVQLSIVIPMSQCMEAFEATLASVLRNRPEHSEILVVSSGDYDDPYALSDEVSFLATPPDTGLLTLINTGLRYAQGEIIHLLLCGAEVEEGWTESALQHFQDPSVGSVSPLIVSSQQRVAATGLRQGLVQARRLAAAGRRIPKKRGLTSRVLGPTLTAGFYRHAAIAELRGLDEGIDDQLADLDLGLMLRMAGYRPRFDPNSRVYADLGDASQPRNFSQAMAHERLIWKHRRSLAAALGHPIGITFEFFVNLFRGGAVSVLFGRGCGMLRALFEQCRPRRTASRRPTEGWTTTTLRQDAPHGSRPKAGRLLRSRDAELEETQLH